MVSRILRKFDSEPHPNQPRLVNNNPENHRNQVIGYTIWHPLVVGIRSSKLHSLRYFLPNGFLSYSQKKIIYRPNQFPSQEAPLSSFILMVIYNWRSFHFRRVVTFLWLIAQIPEILKLFPAEPALELVQVPEIYLSVSVK